MSVALKGLFGAHTKLKRETTNNALPPTKKCPCGNTRGGDESQVGERERERGGIKGHFMDLGGGGGGPGKRERKRKKKETTPIKL